MFRKIPKAFYHPVAGKVDVEKFLNTKEVNLHKESNPKVQSYHPHAIASFCEPSPATVENVQQKYFIHEIEPSIYYRHDVMETKVIRGMSPKLLFPSINRFMLQVL